MLEKDRGIDGNKRINGRKRQYLVDTGGRLWAVVVHAANVADGKGGLTLLDRIDSITERLEKFLGDTSYNGIFAETVVKNGFDYEKSARIGGNEDETVEQPKTGKKFIVQAKRWVVEKSFALFHSKNHTFNCQNKKFKQLQYFPTSSKEWKEQDLEVFFLPKYSPHRNSIETLWRKIKYEWLKPDDFFNWDTLTNALNGIFNSFGSKYKI